MTIGQGQSNLIPFIKGIIVDASNLKRTVSLLSSPEVTIFAFTDDNKIVPVTENYKILPGAITNKTLIYKGQEYKKWVQLKKPKFIYNYSHFKIISQGSKSRFVFANTIYVDLPASFSNAQALEFNIAPNAGFETAKDIATKLSAAVEGEITLLFKGNKITANPDSDRNPIGMAKHCQEIVKTQLGIKTLLRF